MKLAIVGTGGMGREARWMAEGLVDLTAGNIEIDEVVFLTNQAEQHGTFVCETRVAGDIDWLATQKDVRVICAIGDPRARISVVNRLRSLSAKFISLIDPSSIVCPSARIGEGTIVCPNVVISTDVTIGNFCIINIAASISHDCTCEDFVTLAPGVRFAGNVTAQFASECGIQSSVIPRKVVGRGSLVGAGAVVVKDVEENTIVSGIPATFRRHQQSPL